MRDDAKIMRYKNMREDSRQRFMRTGDKEHLADMFTLDREIEKEMNKESRVLGWTLISLAIVTVTWPWIYWLIK